MSPELDLRDGSDPTTKSSGDSGSLPDAASGEGEDLHRVYPGLKRSDWMNGKPFTVTDEMMSSPWNGYRDGRTFRCYMCGEFFKPGCVARFVWCNGIKEARDAGVHCGNVMVCDACDGPDIYARLAEHEQFGQKRYWSLRDYEHLPPNPHSPTPRTRSRR